MLDPLDVLGRSATRHPEHLVAFLQEQLGQIRAVLPRDACDQRPSIRHRAPPYMRVGISLLTLVPGVVGGSETYARELVRALDRVGEHDYRVFRSRVAADLPGKTIESYGGGTSTPSRMLAMTHAAARPGPIRREMEIGSLDAIHFPLTVMLPRVSRTPALVSLLDIQHLFFPEFFSKAELAYRRVAYGWSLRRARVVIAISQHVKETLVDRMAMDPGRIEVIHLGLDHELFRPGDEPRDRKSV